MFANGTGTISMSFLRSIQNSYYSDKVEDIVRIYKQSEAHELGIDHTQLVFYILEKVV